MSAPPTKLNLGCGRKQFPGYLNVDRVESVRPDLVHDLDIYPYPLPSDHFDTICARDVVEHVEDVPRFMAEIWRVAKANAVVEITTPHFSCYNAHTDPTHRRQLGYFSFDYFMAGHQWSFYGSEGFAMKSRSLIFAPSLMNRIVSRLANRWPVRYEERWTWMFPAWFLHFELVVVKQTVTK